MGRGEQCTHTPSSKKKSDLSGRPLEHDPPSYPVRSETKERGPRGSSWNLVCLRCPVTPDSLFVVVGEGRRSPGITRSLSDGAHLKSAVVALVEWKRSQTCLTRCPYLGELFPKS